MQNKASIKQCFLHRPPGRGYRACGTIGWRKKHNGQTCRAFLVVVTLFYGVCNHYLQSHRRQLVRIGYCATTISAKQTYHIFFAIVLVYLQLCIAGNPRGKKRPKIPCGIFFVF